MVMSEQRRGATFVLMAEWRAGLGGGEGLRSLAATGMDVPGAKPLLV